MVRSTGKRSGTCTKMVPTMKASARSPGSSMKIMRRSESGRSKEMDRQEVPGLL